MGDDGSAARAKIPVARVGDFLDDARQLSAEQFTAKHPDWVLIYEDAQSRDFAFDDATTRLAREEKERAMAEPRSERETVLRGVVLPIRKTRKNLYGTRIAVGRTFSSDILIPHQTVSRFHAYFYPDIEGLLLTDAGSRNGTFVGNTPLRTGVAVPVESGNAICFGTATATILSPDGLHDYVRYADSLV